MSEYISIRAKSIDGIIKQTDIYGLCFHIDIILAGNSTPITIQYKDENSRNRQYNTIVKALAELTEMQSKGNTNDGIKRI